MACSQNHPDFATAKTISCTEIQKDIFNLVLEYQPSRQNRLALPGQFFMLRTKPSNVLLCRPISLFHTESINPEGKVRLTFLILRKGQGTSQLCALQPNDIVSLIGPVGNTFPMQNDKVNNKKNKVCIIGGGIGIAPVAGFAQTLAPHSYDFYACFRTGCYGLEGLSPARLSISTDDGSCGTKGMLPNILCADELKQNKYSVVYACGPEPMLKYVQKICKETDIPCYLSMESRMACGMGACLGCTIQTTQGNKRCCKDGPVFLGEELIFTKEELTKSGSSLAVQRNTEEPDLSVEIAGIRFENPVIAASGTFGYGKEYEPLTEVNRLGGICSKGLTLESRPGNTGIRLCETPSGIINSIGLENPGIPHFIAHELPQMLGLKPVAIANLSGSTIDSYAEGARLLSHSKIPMIELNISCPNVKAGGMAFGLEPNAAAEVTSAVKKAAPNKPLIVKLSPNAPDIISVAQSVHKAGADAISLINTVQAISIDIEKGKPLFDNVRAGLSGPAVKPLALRLVYDVVQDMNRLPEKERIPVIALGGISCWQDAVEFIMAGASAIQVGTATFANPICMNEIIDGIALFMKRKGYNNLSALRGIAQI